MKRIMSIVLSIICISVIPMMSYANYDNANGNIIDGTLTINEDLADDKELIAEGSMESLYFFFNNHSIDDSVIDYDRGLKVYVNMPFLENNELTLSDMENYIEEADAMYNIPISYDDYDEFCSITVAKGPEVYDEIRNDSDVDDEEIIAREKRAGHWCATSIGSGEYEADYLKSVYDLLDEYDVHDSYVYCVSGIGNYPALTLVVFRENSQTAEFIPIVDRCKNSDKTIGFIPNTDLGKRTYTYSEMKQLETDYQNSVDTESERLVTGGGYIENNNLQYALIAGGAVLGLCAAALIINLATKKRAKV